MSTKSEIEPNRNFVILARNAPLGVVIIRRRPSKFDATHSMEHCDRLF